VKKLIELNWLNIDPMDGFCEHTDETFGSKNQEISEETNVEVSAIGLSVRQRVPGNTEEVFVISNASVGNNNEKICTRVASPLEMP
jgi:hypothetical protein